MNFKDILKNVIKLLCPNFLILSLNYWRICKDLKSSEKANSLVGKFDEHWSDRIKKVKASTENNFIKRVKDAGKLKDSYIIMHNGVKIYANSYYGSGMLNLLIQNKGVHEPQEEKIFEDLILKLPHDCVMLELGSYWGFYSLSLLNQKPNAKCHLIEPILNNLYCGKLNFKLNRRKGVFNSYFIKQFSNKSKNEVSVDDYCKNNKIDKISILHSDIQGHEVEMLRGSNKMLEDKRIDYLFISTHSALIHQSCLEILNKMDYTILCSTDLTKSDSIDGLIVACSSVIKFSIIN